MRHLPTRTCTQIECSVVVLWLACATLAGLVQSARAQQGADNTALALWHAQAAEPAAHAQHARAWLAFADGEAGALAPLAHTMAAWHLLRAERPAEARALWERYADADRATGIARAAREISRSWLTCLDRETVVAALALYRRDALRYPADLETLGAWAAKLPQPQHPVPTDRWGQPWNYQLEALRTMPQLEGQRYRLTSRALGPLSLLRDALALSHGERITLRPVQIRQVPNRPPLVALMGPDGGAPALIQVGSQHAGVGVVHLSPRIVVLHDRLHWKLSPTPGE